MGKRQTGREINTQNKVRIKIIIFKFCSVYVYLVVKTYLKQYNKTYK